MVDLIIGIAGLLIGSGALAHSMWLSSAFRSGLAEKIDAQRQHALMLWPRAWDGGTRPLTQVEEIVEAGRTWLGDPLDPEEQRREMMENSQRLMDSYKPKPPSDGQAQSR